MTGAAAPPATCDFDTVSVRDLSRHYGRRRALSRVSLDFSSGTVTGLFGPNGSGKSTLLGTLSTLAQPSLGSVHYGQQTAREWGDVLRSRIGVLGHDLFLYPELTARENLEFFGRLHHVADLRAAVDRALELGRLTARASDRAGGFSRGLRQRLALERALLHEPKLVLLDEPFTGLDDASASILVERLRALKAAGAIVVMATHDFDVAAEVVHHAVCLIEGRMRVIEPGSGTLRERYRAVVARGAA